MQYGFQKNYLKFIHVIFVHFTLVNNLILLTELLMSTVRKDNYVHPPVSTVHHNWQFITLK